MKYIPLILIALLVACAAEKESTGAKELAQQLREQAEIDAATPVQETQEEQSESAETNTQVTETPAQEEEPAQTETATNLPETAQQEETIPAETQAQELPIIEATEETEPAERTPLYDFLDTFAKKVSGYQFIHKSDQYFVKGTKLKIVLDKPRVARQVKLNGIAYSLFYYDTVYVDRAAKKATAYCEGRETELNRQCVKMNLHDVPYAVPFSEYNILLPEDWLFSFLDKNPVRIDKDKYIVLGKSAHSYTFRQGDDSTELFFDDITGLPVRADQIKYGRLISRYDYEFLASNKVRDVDVIYRSQSEIPSEEYFYKR